MATHSSILKAQVVTTGCKSEVPTTPSLDPVTSGAAHRTAAALDSPDDELSVKGIERCESTAVGTLKGGSRPPGTTSCLSSRAPWSPHLYRAGTGAAGHSEL